MTSEEAAERSWKQVELPPVYDPRHWLTENRSTSVWLTVAYILFLILGQHFMRSKQPLPLSKAFLVWNIVLTLFSFAGLVGVIPEFYRSITKDGFVGSYCRIGESYYSGYNGYWVYLFHLSKAVELGDTVFLVLRKRPVIFLHWYHHATVLVYLWYTYDQNVGPTRWGVAMNFFVHLVMYAYFAAKSARLRCPGWMAVTVTTIQIAQFVLGTFFCAHSTYLVFVEGPKACDTTLFAASSSSLIYLSYLVLFMQFFYGAYLVKSSKGSKKIE